MDKRPPEEWCWQTLRNLRWGEAIFCPRCQGKARRHHRRRYTDYYWCRHCERMFSDLTSTPFENTKISLSAWFLAIDLLGSEDQVTTSDFAQRTRTNRKTGRRMKEKLWRLHSNSLIRSIGVDLLLWKRKILLTKKSEAALTRDSKVISDLITTIASSKCQKS